MRGIAGVVGVVALGALVGWPGIGRAADPPKDVVKAFPDMVAALKASPGCLGVETARTGSGKSVIFAWFENKKAALAWFHGEIHQEAMKRYLPDVKSGRKPLVDVPDDSGPIMVVASLTPNTKPTKENPSPFKQLAIEVYQPLGDGLDIGGRFAPEKMKAAPRK
jgi:hypothetical protein